MNFGSPDRYPDASYFVFDDNEYTLSLILPRLQNSLEFGKSLNGSGGRILDLQLAQEQVKHLIVPQLYARYSRDLLFRRNGPECLTNHRTLAAAYRSGYRDNGIARRQGFRETDADLYLLSAHEDAGFAGIGA